MTCLIPFNGDLYAGGTFTIAGGVSVNNVAKWNPGPASVGDHSLQRGIPGTPHLNQNYPNPFNPTTVIRYEISVTSFVTLEMYNVLGQEVATLVNELKQPGRYEARWNAEKLSSGVYFYRLQAGEYAETKKLILLK